MPKKTKHPKSKTERQKKLIKLISENLSTGKITKSMYQMFLDAGFSESTARQQQLILAGIKDELEPIVKAMIKERNAVIKAMKSKRGKAKYRDLTDALDKLTKNVQLLSGGKTENVGLSLSRLLEESNKEIE